MAWLLWTLFGVGVFAWLVGAFVSAVVWLELVAMTGEGRWRTVWLLCLAVVWPVSLPLLKLRYDIQQRVMRRLSESRKEECGGEDR